MTETEVDNILEDLLGGQIVEAYGRQGVASVYITQGMKNAIYTNSKEPDWIKEYEFEGKREIISDLDEKRADLDRFQKLERLPHGSGDPLEESLELAFDILGIDYETTEEDEDFRIEHNGTKLIIEVKGKGGRLNKSEANQLDGWVDRWIDKEVPADELEGVAIINHERHKPPSDRGDPLTDKAKQFLNMRSYTFYTTSQLFQLVKTVEEEEREPEDAKEEFLEAIGNGE